MRKALCILAMFVLAVSVSANPGINDSGDVNCDFFVNISDAIALDAYLNSGGSLCCPSVGDVNDDGSVNNSDVAYLLNYLFGVPPGPAPTGPSDICR